MGNVWLQSANIFSPGNDTLKTEVIPPGVYSYGENNQGWFLIREQDRYEFGYKIYGKTSEIIRRVAMAWEGLDSNLGILLNGVRGTGKTVSARLMANWALERGVPVLVVSSPIPLGSVLSSLQQDVVVIFDEFEKTHPDGDGDREQERLLSALDGMSNSQFKRLFIFTTNDRDLNENLLDRPGRIRYIWEFSRLSQDIVDEIIDDLLEPDLKHLRGDINRYLKSRSVLSVDVVKTVIKEVNLFREPPSAFGSFLNVSQRTLYGFTVNAVDPITGRKVLITKSFKPNIDDSKYLLELLDGSRRDWALDSIRDEYLSIEGSGLTIKVIDIPKRDNCLLCRATIASYLTWTKDFPGIGLYHSSGLKLGLEPEDWKIPDWANYFRGHDTDTSSPGFDRADRLRSEYYHSDSVYGNKGQEDVLLEFIPNLKAPTF